MAAVLTAVRGRVCEGLEVAQAPQAGAFLAGEDEMVEQPAVESLCGACEAACRAQVGRAGTGISTRVIVGDQERRAAVHRGVDDDVSKREVEPANVALVTGEVKAARLIVEMSDPEALPRRILLLEAT